jgi:hypothetical protein
MTLYIICACVIDRNDVQVKLFSGGVCSRPSQSTVNIFMANFVVLHLEQINQITENLY